MARTPWRSRPSRRPRPAAAVRSLAAGLALAVPLSLLGGCDGGKDEPFMFGGPTSGPKAAPGQPVTVYPRGPRARFAVAGKVEDGTRIGVATLRGRKSGFTGKVWVWAPPQYFDPAYAHSGFPVLEALPGGHGYPVNYWMGTDLGLQSGISRWSREGKSLPFIVVMPVLNPDFDHYYDGSDIPGQPRMGTWVAEDVPDFVRANFRTFASRDGWAFMGSSSGGFVGLKSVLQHPDRFKAVIASGPDTVPDSPLWRGHEAARRANDPGRLASRLVRRPDTPANDVYLAFQLGSRETGIAPDVRRFIHRYTKGPVKSRLQVIPDGGHNARTYIRGLEAGSIEWISQWLQPPVPDRRES
ncbi:alpha/beta hydrolase-fold protein [Streptomyces sp. SR27]|uniref:alpha/beta hydrolase n=1 Tax=unclassified Streptomyces TaxID=2593676 RepID=UPI00295AD8EA|nr:alpha/beta hydrolase-fold protein [Streptomyces sp. SR27]MDV9191342.1 alpha/beta hydrolase-fold protein [Streptomyces sp. SR27]